MGNVNTEIINFTIDNTPPVITATLNPNTISFVDFSDDRYIGITAQSSPDTETVYAVDGIDGSESPLTYSNGYWTLNLGVPNIITI